LSNCELIYLNIYIYLCCIHRRELHSSGVSRNTTVTLR